MVYFKPDNNALEVTLRRKPNGEEIYEAQEKLYEGQIIVNKNGTLSIISY